MTDTYDPECPTGDEGELAEGSGEPMVLIGLGTPSLGYHRRDTSVQSCRSELVDITVISLPAPATDASSGRTICITSKDYCCSSFIEPTHGVPYDCQGASQLLSDNVAAKDCAFSKSWSASDTGLLQPAAASGLGLLSIPYPEEDLQLQNAGTVSVSVGTVSTACDLTASILTTSEHIAQHRDDVSEAHAITVTTCNVAGRHDRVTKRPNHKVQQLNKDKATLAAKQWPGSSSPISLQTITGKQGLEHSSVTKFKIHARPPLKASAVFGSAKDDEDDGNLAGAREHSTAITQCSTEAEQDVIAELASAEGRLPSFSNDTVRIPPSHRSADAIEQHTSPRPATAVDQHPRRFGRTVDVPNIKDSIKCEDKLLTASLNMAMPCVQKLAKNTSYTSRESLQQLSSSVLTNPDQFELTLVDCKPSLAGLPEGSIKTNVSNSASFSDYEPAHLMKSVNASVSETMSGKTFSLVSPSDQNIVERNGLRMSPDALASSSIVHRMDSSKAPSDDRNQHLSPRRHPTSSHRSSPHRRSPRHHYSPRRPHSSTHHLPPCRSPVHDKSSRHRSPVRKPSVSRKRSLSRDLRSSRKRSSWEERSMPQKRSSSRKRSVSRNRSSSRKRSSPRKNSSSRNQSSSRAYKSSGLRSPNWQASSRHLSPSRPVSSSSRMSSSASPKSPMISVKGFPQHCSSGSGSAQWQARGSRQLPCAKRSRSRSKSPKNKTLSGHGCASRSSSQLFNSHDEERGSQQRRDEDADLKHLTGCRWNGDQRKLKNNNDTCYSSVIRKHVRGEPSLNQESTLVIVAAEQQRAGPEPPGYHQLQDVSGHEQRKRCDTSRIASDHRGQSSDHGIYGHSQQKSFEERDDDSFDNAAQASSNSPVYGLQLSESRRVVAAEQILSCIAPFSQPSKDACPLPAFDSSPKQGTGKSLHHPIDDAAVFATAKLVSLANSVNSQVDQKALSIRATLTGDTSASSNLPLEQKQQVETSGKNSVVKVEHNLEDDCNQMMANYVPESLPEKGLCEPTVSPTDVAASATSATQLRSASQPFVSLVPLTVQELSKATIAAYTKKKSNDKVFSAMEIVPDNNSSSSKGEDICDDTSPETVIIDTKQSSADNESLPHFGMLVDNIILSERKKEEAKMRKRTLACDCTTSEEDRRLGIPACGDGCLNRTLMMECGSRCPCGEYCTNKRFERHQYAETEPFKTELKGWGLRSTKDLPSNHFVLEYVGEVLDFKEFRRRTKQYAKDRQHKHHYFMALKADEIIDATQQGNVSRFINHSCDPNCETQKWDVGGRLRVGFFTRRPVSAGEELTFDYQFERYGKEAQKCYCGSANCRGTLGGEKVTPLKSSITRTKKKEAKASSLFDYVDTLDDEIGKLSEQGGLHKSDHVLQLSRLMTRAENIEQQRSLLDILLEAPENCLRLFLGYHGLSILWSLMVDAGMEGSMAYEFRIQIIRVLRLLPVQSKNPVQDSKVLSVVQQWNKEISERNSGQDTVPSSHAPVGAASSEDSSASAEETVGEVARVSKPRNITCTDVTSSGCFISSDVSNAATTDSDPGSNAEHVTAPTELLSNQEGSILDSGKSPKTVSPTEESPAAMLSRLTADLLDHWSNLKETFKIPKKQQLEERKRTEQEIDKQVEDMPRDGWSHSIRRSYGDRTRNQRLYDNSRNYKESSSWDESGRRNVGNQDSSKELAKSHLEDGIKRRVTTDPYDRKRKRDSFYDASRSHSRPGIKNPRYSVTRKMTKEEKRQQFEARVRAREQMVQHEATTSSAATPSGNGGAINPKGLSKDLLTPSSSGEATPVTSTASLPTSDTAAIAVPVPSSRPAPAQPHAPSGGNVTAPFPAVSGAFMQPPFQAVMGSYIDTNKPCSYGSLYGYGAAVQPPAPPQQPSLLLAYPPPPFGVNVPQQQMHGQHHNSAYGTSLSIAPVYGATPYVTSVCGQTLTGADIYSAPPPLPSCAGAYGDVSGSGSTFGSMSMGAAYGVPTVISNNYSHHAVDSSRYGVVPAGAGQCIPPPTVYNGLRPSMYVQQPGIPFQQHGMLQSSAFVSCPDIQSGTSASPMISLPATITKTAQAQHNLVPILKAVMAPLCKDDDKPPPPPSPPMRKLLKLPPNWKTAVDSEGRTYFYHAATRQRQWHPPVWDTATNVDLSTPTFDETKLDKKISKKTRRAAADTSSEESSKKLSEFKTAVSLHVRSCLNHYTKEDCKVGRIVSKEDYKMLAKKYTHTIVDTEVKNLEHKAKDKPNPKEYLAKHLQFSDNVKAKVKAYIKRVMSRCGTVPQQGDSKRDLSE